MTTQQTPAPGPEGPAPEAFAATARSPAPVVLRQRADFLRAAKAWRQGAPSFLLQARRRDAAEDAGPALVRVGFTCSKKVGNAVARNRARRRLREVARLVLLEHGRPGWDYVLIGRAVETAARDFRAMQDDLRRTLAKIHGASGAP